jgi:phosphatidylserine/phosphatidylglycerophosphate/cardiolipin synthase-like enzyme
MAGFRISQLRTLNGAVPGGNNGSVAARHQKWLAGLLPFPGQKHKPGELIPSDAAPIQKFRWSDYTVYPNTEYSYIVHPVYGSPANLDIRPGPTVKVKTGAIDSGEFRVIFNRAVVGSQAFQRQFPAEAKTLDKAMAKAKRAKKPAQKNVTLSPEALKWLSRGLVEEIEAFLSRAVDNTWAVDICIYEYELDKICDAVNAAHSRHANVRVVYHAKPSDKRTKSNAKLLAPLGKAALRPRVTSKICHDKYIILSKLDEKKRAPVSVLCGSTNFTENGVYRQFNVVQVVEDPDTAAEYLKMFEFPFAGNNPAKTKKYITQHNPVSSKGDLFVGFSPRAGNTDLKDFVAEVDQSRRDVLFCVVFSMDKSVRKAILGKPNDPILRYGISNAPGNIKGYDADKTRAFTTPALLPNGLEGWLNEDFRKQKGSIHIHAKVIVVDFTTDAPTVISGSHNFSQPASSGNDENYLIIRGNRDVADYFGCELLRIYDHYRFRFVAKKAKAKKGPRLTPDDSWTRPYFNAKDLKMTDRLRFTGS